MKILISGFKPFLGESINPSEKIAIKLAQIFAEVESVVLPVVYSECFQILESKVRQFQPDLLIMLGQAGGRSTVTVEKIALNHHQARAADESGYKPEVGPILPNQPLALQTIFPVDILVSQLKSSGLPIDVSCHAGTFVCNYLFHQALNRFPDLNPIFVHVPFLPEQLGVYQGESDQSNLKSMPSMPLTDQIKVIESIIQWCLKN